MRKFNVTGLCINTEDYMVNIDDKLKKIAEMVKNRQYFVMNCPRQYGKTTTLASLKQLLKDEYIIVSISFEGLGNETFETSEIFCLSFMKLVKKSLYSANISNEYKDAWFNKEADNFMDLSDHITEMCKNKKVVLMIDEVDKMSNNQVFLQFLSMLRAKYLSRKLKEDYTFHSVILAGVYDVKNIKLKMINEGSYSPLATEGTVYNSPWNIAAEFNVDMSFKPIEIEFMIKDYQAENNISIDTKLISQEIYKYTSGYPFLVSYICKVIDEELDKKWSEEGILEAVKTVLSKNNTLFDDLTKNLENYKELYDFLYSILIIGEYKVFDIHNPIVNLGSIFGYIKKEDNTGKAVITNRIFETLMINYFISKDSSI